jgi:hypothetical protein
VHEPKVFTDGEKIPAKVCSVSENNSGQPQPATREREVRALTDAMRSLGLDHGLTLTEGEAAYMTENDLTIEVHSLAEWLLQLSPVS